MADEVAGTFGAMAVMMAIYHRDKTGEGQWIDLSLYEPLFRYMVPNVPEYDQNRYVRQRMGNELLDAAPRNLYQAKDGKWISMSASTQGIFERLAHAIERSEIVEEPRFKDNLSRVENRVELNAIIQEWVGNHSLDETIDLWRKAGAVVGPVYDSAMIDEDPHYAAREDIISVPDPDLGQLKMHATIPKFSKTPGNVYSTGPALGEHNEIVYGEWLGYDSEKISALKDQGIT